MFKLEICKLNIFNINECLVIESATNSFEKNNVLQESRPRLQEESKLVLPEGKYGVPDRMIHG